MDRRQMLDLLVELSNGLAEVGEPGTMFVVGGAAMVLAYDDQRSTHDIDAVFEPRGMIRQQVEAVAERLELDPAWLNDAAKGFMPGPDANTQTVFQTKWLRVNVASPHYLLAMKLFAARPELDAGDAVRLWHLVGFSDPGQGVELLTSMYPSRLLEPRHRYMILTVAEMASEDSATPTPVPLTYPTINPAGGDIIGL